MVSFDFDQVAGFIINTGAVAAVLYGVYRALRKWVQRAASEASTAAAVVQRQLKTSNGRTVADYVESSAHQLEALMRDLAATRDVVTATAVRLDQHIEHHSAIDVEPED